ncbi:putative bifunctional diguanylate cyclase/phosphodiesterase [Sphingomonas prati]|uniref:Diguanylate cyclase (GGDEF)-like protein/PAS domain S-box-containing protein n=1 Tax=Sphingomonas prati TaxID=1843237 RepID=A0A7W9BPX5_9SPHN|nr:EAL domain-containing protein [Sphingomonas prati]MBB5727855.1 diguanylate cyclase (GGDEF)-like protein/PAS domain S-box-containing protein [Sphingomonas prati]GGE81342.1 GGDEF domain-containing protein [Sphingomonas prati]
MHIELPVLRADDAIDPAYDVGSQSARLGVFEAIVEQAARATACSTAMICAMRDGELVPLAVNRTAALPTVIPYRMGADGSVVPDVAICVDGSPIALGFRGEGGDDVRFAAAAPIGGTDGALLIVLDTQPRAGLSAAQTYVLRSHTAHLATLFDLIFLQDRVDNRAGKASLERLRLLESVAVHARDSIVITEAQPVDLPGPCIIYCNAAFTRTTGYTAEEVIGLTPRVLQGPKTDPKSRALLRRALETWQPIEIEIINYRRDGSEFWVELSIVPVANERGWFTHWVSVQRDITERKAAQELSARVRVAELENQALAGEILERKRIEAELLYTAFHDNLTRLRNRAFFMERLSKALDRERLQGATTCSVLFLDLDRFKVVNDSLGHLAGDALMKEVAQRLRRCVRPQDTLARIGGDEFAILIEDAADLNTPVRIAEAIIEALRAPVQLGRQSVFPSASIGVVPAGEPGVVPDDLMRDADIAMYQAKRAGGGDYAIFDATMHDDAVSQLTLQTDLRQAVERGEFHLAYQPIVDPASGAIQSFEALLRWTHPVRGPISPADFVPVAEEIGLIRQIDRWVMHEACAQLAQWQRRFDDPALRLSINVSAAGFVDRDFVTALSDVLDEFGLRPQTLELEITEGIFLHPSAEIAGAIGAVRDMGVRIALDDFGTGYSSLSYINRYPIDTIKIDKSFIDGVGSNRETRAIVELIVKLGATLDLNIIAEGVETQAQTDILMQIGCRAIQGYHFAKPLTPEDATRVLAAGGAAAP